MSTSAWRPTRTVTLRGDDGIRVVVRELDWRSALDFLALVSAHARALIAPIIEQASAGGASPEQSRAVIFQEIVRQGPELVLKIRELGDFLLANAVEDASAIEGRGVADVLAVLRAALELNLSAEVLEAVAALGKSAAAALTPSPTPPRPQ